jgi:hypothetical protein
MIRRYKHCASFAVTLEDLSNPLEQSWAWKKKLNRLMKLLHRYIRELCEERIKYD